MSAPTKPSYADMVRKTAPESAPLTQPAASVVAPVVPAPPAASALVRRARANSVGGSLYEGVNSGNVTRTDVHTREVTTISGDQMHRAVRLGNERHEPAAEALHQQNHAYNYRNLAGPRNDQHAPMGCVEARLESAIAFHHIQGNESRRNVRAAWSNSAQSVFTAVTDQRENVVPACGWCEARGHPRGN